jgi:hypothetical protein
LIYFFLKYTIAQRVLKHAIKHIHYKLKRKKDTHGSIIWYNIRYNRGDFWVTKTKQHITHNTEKKKKNRKKNHRHRTTIVLWMYTKRYDICNIQNIWQTLYKRPTHIHIHPPHYLTTWLIKELREKKGIDTKRESKLNDNM